jgi:hypothetical protein
MGASNERFSRRHGYTLPDAEITIREDAPGGLRATLLDAAGRHLSPKECRAIICRAVHELPDRNNWSDGNVWEEAQRLVEDAEWPHVYDIIEMMYARLAEREPGAARAFEGEINAYFRETGIGWQLIDGKIETRGTETFETTVRGSERTLAEARLPTASQEIREALNDLSRRPVPDLTGALQHGMAALECAAREACGESQLTLGDIVKKYPALFPKPLDVSVEKAWGFASERGRHLKEGQQLDRVEVEYVVGLAATVATYLASKRPSAT